MTAVVIVIEFAKRDEGPEQLGRPSNSSAPTSEAVPAPFVFVGPGRAYPSISVIIPVPAAAPDSRDEATSPFIWRLVGERKAGLML